MSTSPIATLVELIEQALFTETDRSIAITAIRNFVESNAGDEEQWEIARDLAWDLAFYEPNADLRNDDLSYYGDDRLKQELWNALTKLRAMD